ncbi:hypothetical protein TRFO_37150 [Tritrichomonas foetus]|uniref:Uncharacterized protein n=1 Tax=Tritrichomonas foetus TaxID=1144522 RepID=A0A1J4JEB3_9EUKA|nr:hypothetical protein TRFO_37150 [Tritrichomonas foetus]|eukprot:OHS96631.1 hypothetical protein TRFO_37150 [Tritrichomonas foetus]
MERIKDSFHYFTEEGYLELYKLTYGTSPFPFWVTIQILWSAFIVHQSYRWLNTRYSGILSNLVMLIVQLITAFCMSFGPRELVSIIFHKDSPLASHPLSIAIFIFIFGLLKIPLFLDLIAKTKVSFLIAFFYGLNQFRFFTLLLRTVDQFDNLALLAIAIAFGSIDQIIEIIFRTISKANQTGGSNIILILKFVCFATVHWFLIHIFDLPVVPIALIMANFQAITNAIAIISGEPKQPNGEEEEEIEEANKNKRSKKKRQGTKNKKENSVDNKEKKE